MDNQLSTAHFFASVLDTRFSILGFRFGIDPIIGLVPILGHILSIICCLYMLMLGSKMNIPNSKKIEMIVNSLIDYFVGEIPILGSLVDATFKSNTRNYLILKNHFGSLYTVIESK